MTGGSKVNTTPRWPKWLKPHLQAIPARAEELFNASGAPPGLRPETREGLDRRAMIARSGNTVGGAASEEARRILRGEYLDPNTNPNFQRAMGEAMGAASGRFAGSGRVGSGAYAGALADAATGVAGQMYDRERGRQMQTLSLTDLLSGAEYADAAQLEDVGSAYQEDEMRQFEWPYERLDRFTDTITALNPAGGSRTTEQQRFDPLSAAVSIGSAYASRPRSQTPSSYRYYG